MIEEYAPTIVYALLVFMVLLFAMLIGTYMDNKQKLTPSDVKNLYKASQKRQQKEIKRAVKLTLPPKGSVWLIELGTRNERRIKIMSCFKDALDVDMIRFKELNVFGISILPLHMWDKLNKELLR